MAGHYKIFLGMAAGVGKTYRMLQEGKAEQTAGRDVVIGYLEPHERAGDRQRRPRAWSGCRGARSSYRGIAIEEMDLPAVFDARARSSA